MSLQGLRDSDICELTETSVRSLKRFHQTHREMGGVPSLPPINNGCGCRWGKLRGFTRTVSITMYSNANYYNAHCSATTPSLQSPHFHRYRRCVVNPALAGRWWWLVLVELFSSGWHWQRPLFCCRCTMVVVMVVGRGLCMWLHWWGGCCCHRRHPGVHQ
ncbi:hypothetical protein EDB86DRAFT_2977791 [Lactarius hatsudake]|nr:hypothetical protein EDB86DRAFT_2977791 [Lactarius hatsudake]